MTKKEENQSADNINAQEEKAVEVRQERSIQGFSLQPRNLQEAMRICEYLSKSDLVPKDYRGKPQDILVCINHGLEVGLQPLQALSNIAVINGRPALWGSAPLALARQNRDFEWILEDNEAFAYARDKVKGWEHLKGISPDTISVCVIKRKGQPPAVRAFSEQDVKVAGLGNVHKNYPKDMRKYRARSRALEAVFGDSLKGFRQAEIEAETSQMIEDGYYEDLDANPKEQPVDRKPIDIGEAEVVKSTKPSREELVEAELPFDKE